MRILVTGAKGQLGLALRRLAETGVAVDSAEWLFTDVAELDITDRVAVEAFFERERPDVTVNCAAYTDVDRAESEEGSAAAFGINADGVRFLAEATAARGGTLIHISTDFVFDGRADRPYTEEDIGSPLNVYGKSKMKGAMAILESGCRGAIVRTSWLYSPWGRNFVKSILNAAAMHDELRVVVDQTGCPTSAISLAGAIVRMIPVLASSSCPAEHYNFCDAGIVSRAAFAYEIVRQAGLNCRIVPVTSAEYPTAAKRPAYSALDTSKITRDFGIVPRRWQEELAQCINDIRNGC